MSRLMIATTLLVASAAAQNTTVVPSPYATVEGNSSTAYPFGLTTTSRVQYVYDTSLVAVPVMSVTRIATRGNGGTAIAAKPNVDLEVMMSNSTVSPWAPSTTFASNHGSNLATPFTRKLINLPALPSTPTPGPFAAVVPFDTPFLCNTTLGNLVIDYTIHTAAAGSYSHDTQFTYAAQNTAVGTACGATQAVTGGSATSNTATLGFNLSGALANAPAVHLLGLKSMPAGVPLPFSTCSLYQDAALITSVTTSATGTASMPYPLRYWYKGVTVNGQYVVLDSATPALAASQSHTVTIGGYDPQARIYNLSSATSATGTVQVGVGIVTELTY